MIWGLLGLILVVVLAALAVTNKSVGRALPLACALIVGIIGFFAWYQNHQLDLAKQRIPAAEVELADMALSDEARGKYLAGRVRNHSRQFTLTELRVRISVQDCLDGRCEVINQTDIALKPNAPPGQARDFREPLYFKSAIAPRGKLALRYDVVSTRGE